MQLSLFWNAFFKKNGKWVSSSPELFNYCCVLRLSTDALWAWKSLGPTWRKSRNTHCIQPRPGLHLHKGQKGKQSSRALLGADWALGNWSLPRTCSFALQQLKLQPEILNSLKTIHDPKYVYTIMPSSTSPKPTHLWLYSKVTWGTGRCSLEHQRSTARLPRHTAGPLKVLKQELVEGQGKQGAEYIMPLVTTEICSFRGRQIQESPL